MATVKRDPVVMIGASGRKSERRLARQLGGRARPNSGATPGAKGDIELDRVLLEAKSSTGDRIGLDRRWLAKIAAEARAVGRIPALALSFTYGDGWPIPDGEWVCVPLWLWRERLAGDDDDGAGP
jgi:hypothetical protein